MGRASQALEEIEKDHQAIARLIHDMEIAVKENNAEALRSLLDQLQKLEQQHCVREEEIMKQFGVSDYRIHKDQHDVMQLNLKELAETITIEDLGNPDNELARHFKNLLYHLISIDEDMRKFLERASHKVEWH